LTANDSKKFFLEHLEELRGLVACCLFLVFCFVCISFLFSRNIFEIIMMPACRAGVSDSLTGISNAIALQSLHPAEVFLMNIKISLLAGICLSFPMIVLLVWNYVKPTVKAFDLVNIKLMFFFFALLLVLGMTFSYYVALPLGLKFLFKFSINYGVNPVWTLSNYSNFVISMLFAFGIAFELPLITAVSVKIGLIDIKRIFEYRKYIVIIILLISALLTPPDVVSQLMLSVPLIVLFEMSILISRVIFVEKIKE